MRLNSISPAIGSKSKTKRVGRGIGSGLGKTGGRGHKGQKSRSGGVLRREFEGGQMPLYRRLPKFGFISSKSLSTMEVRLSDLVKIKSDVVNLNSLKSSKIISAKIKTVKIILSGEIFKPITVSGLRVSRGARIAIESVGGRIEE